MAATSIPKLKVVTRRVVEMSGCACGHFETSRPYGKGASYPTKWDALWEMQGEFLMHLTTCRVASPELKLEAQATAARHHLSKPLRSR